MAPRGDWYGWVGCAWAVGVVVVGASRGPGGGGGGEEATT